MFKSCAGQYRIGHQTWNSGFLLFLLASPFSTVNISWLTQSLTKSLVLTQPRMHIFHLRSKSLNKLLIDVDALTGLFSS